MAAKAETTPGTPVSLTATDAAMNCFDPDLQPSADFTERPSQGASIAPIAGVPGPFSGTLKFQTDLTGGSSPPSWATTLLPAVGFGAAVNVYSPDSRPAALAGSLQKCLTMGLYEDGEIKKLAGCQGKLTIKGPAGKPLRCDWEFQGVWQPPAAGAILAPTYPTTAPLILEGVTFTIGGTPLTLHEIEIAIDNTITLLPDAAATRGIAYAAITARKITIKATIEAIIAGGTYDPHADWLARTERALALEIGTTGNKVAFAAPKLQITNVQEAAAEGVQTEVIEFVANRSLAAGEDELTLTFS
jgi:hypothetical protein